MMRRDWNALLKLEKQTATYPRSVPLIRDLELVLTPVIRLMFLAFEENNFDPLSPAGRSVMAGLLSVLPDSKIVEDCHGVLRVANKKMKNRRMTFHAMQDLLTRSTVLESREINHQSKIDKATFIAQFGKTRLQPRKKRLGFQDAYIYIYI